MPWFFTVWSSESTDQAWPDGEQTETEKTQQTKIDDTQEQTGYTPNRSDMLDKQTSQKMWDMLQCGQLNI